MNPDISLLIDLQKKDSSILALEKDAASKDPLIQKKKQEIENHKNKLAENKKGLQAAQLKKKELENDASSKEALIAKHQGELNSVKTNDAYKALLAEIETAKGDLSKIEDAELELLEKIDLLEKEASEKEKTAKDEEQTFKNQLSRLEKEKAELADKASGMKKDRDEFAKTVPAPLLQQYETIRQRREGVGIAPVIKGACGGCRMSMSPGKASDAKNKKGIVTCDSCNRILYAPAENEEEKTAGPSTTA